MQLAHPEVAQPKLEAIRPQVYHCSFSEPCSEQNEIELAYNDATVQHISYNA